MSLKVVRALVDGIWETTVENDSGGGGGGGGGIEFDVDNSGGWFNLQTSRGEDDGLWGITLNAVGGAVKITSDTTALISAPDMNIQTTSGGLTLTSHSSINMESTASLLSFVSNDKITLSLAIGLNAVLEPDGSGGERFILKHSSTPLLTVTRDSGGVMGYHIKSGASWQADL